MDWYVIQFLYPKALDEFIKTMFPNTGIISLTILQCYDIKKLYGFFDRRGIFLTIEMVTKNNWSFTINTSLGVTISQSSATDNDRENIEKDGFLECFRVLDKQLRNE